MAEGHLKTSNHGSLTSEQIDALWTIDHPFDAYNKLRIALAEHPESADELRTQISRSLGLMGKFDEAWGEIAKVSKESPEVVKVRIQLESGRLKNSSGSAEDSKPYFLRALELAARGHFDYYAVDAVHMLGIVSKGPECVQWNEKGLELAESSNDERTRKWRGSLLNNLGWTYFNMGDFNKALATFEAALDYQKGAGDPVRIRIARWTIARCLRALKRYDAALAIQSELIQHPEQGYVSEELGELLLAMERPREAKLRFKKAYELLARNLGADPRQTDRLARLRELSQ
jgi:tetratricopeptide (TPR) repeat protein